MFDEVKLLIEKSSAPEAVRLALSLVTKLISWLPYAFVGVGLFLNTANFIYWLAFFIFAEGALIAALIYMLLLIVRDAVAVTHKNEPQEDKLASNNFSDTALKGIVGNFAFYLFILVAFIVLKAMGIFDVMFQTTLERLK